MSMDRSSDLYLNRKSQDSDYLFQAVSRALAVSVDELRERADVQLVGSPLTHERFLRRSKGSYGATWQSMLSGPATALDGLLLCGDSIFPGIGIPAVALSGTWYAKVLSPSYSLTFTHANSSAANTAVSVLDHIAEVLRNK